MHNRISNREDSALFVDEIRVVIEGNGMKSEIPLRITSLFFYRENTSKLVHWHGSVAVESEEDTRHLNEWKKKTEALEKLVAEKTADLVQKNRDLEIEAKLERVRARTMAMQRRIAGCSCLIVSASKSIGSTGIQLRI